MEVCIWFQSGEREDGLKHYMDQNAYIDIILKEVLQYAGDRRIVLSCFDPEICTMWVRVLGRIYKAYKISDSTK